MRISVTCWISAGGFEVRAVPTFYEFFAGGGMVRGGLGNAWRCLLANDIDPKKGACYESNWGGEHLRIADVAALTTEDVPGRADLAWASFPCQDLSLAGDYSGLQGKRSGAFWLFWRLMTSLAKQQRAPTIIVLENVCGALTSHQGKDFEAISSALIEGGYRLGAFVIDAIRFVPQSRPRLFIVGVRRRWPIPVNLESSQRDPSWRPRNLISAYEKLPERCKDAWVWWWLPGAPRRQLNFADIIEDEPEGVEWHTAEQTERLLGMMSPINWEKVEKAKLMRRRIVGGIYRRTRENENGKRTQRAEVRFDDVAGCLRTPIGGSSRQTIMVVEGDRVRSRLLSPREAARLMGLPDTYKLPRNYNDAYHVAGDGVVVPVVRFLGEHLLEPLSGFQESEREATG